MIMRDVNNGWIIRYVHANVASFFFIFVYAHVGRGLYYSSYKNPRVLLWSIGVIILVLMMANENIWPNYEHDFTKITYTLSSMLPINKSRTKAILRIGPHNKETLDIIVCGMLGDYWADIIPGKTLNSTRIQIEQSIINSAYIHYLTLYFYNLGYCARPVPVLVTKTHKNTASGFKEKTFNYRLTLFTFTSLTWIYDSFYTTAGLALQRNQQDKPNKKRVPFFISEYLTPVGLAHWIMQDGSYQKGQGIYIATNSFTYEDCKFLALILSNKFNLKTSVIKTGKPDQWRISIWKNSLPRLVELVEPYFIPEMKYKLNIKNLV